MNANELNKLFEFGEETKRNSIKDRKFNLIFKHEKDQDEQIKTYTMFEIIFGIGETRQPITDIIYSFEKDGYRLIDITMEELKGI